MNQGSLHVTGILSLSLEPFFLVYGVPVSLQSYIETVVIFFFVKI